MNSICELEVQNLHDSWCILYYSLANSLVVAESDGEGKLRSIVRKYGAAIGLNERESHQEQGIKINLKNFFSMPRHRCYDPRLFVNQQRLNEQVALYDVIRCPFSQCAKQYHSEYTAKIFCEEYSAACIDAYTEQVSQVNLSEILTEPQNNHCRISAYYRPGNVGASKYQSYFDQFDEPMIETIGVEQKISDAVGIWNRSALLLWDVFVHDESSPNWIETAIKRATESLADFFQRRSTSMEQKLGLSFLEKNCAFPVAKKDLEVLAGQLACQLLQNLGLNKEVQS